VEKNKEGNTRTAASVNCSPKKGMLVGWAGGERKLALAGKRE